MKNKLEIKSKVIKELQEDNEELKAKYQRLFEFFQFWREELNYFDLVQKVLQGSLNPNDLKIN